MFLNQYRNGHRRIYEADAAWCEQVKAARRKLADICESCKNRTVRVETLDGEVYEGTLVGTGGSHLYLSVQDKRFFSPWGYGFGYGGYGSFILPLVLFDLLTLTLLI